VYPVHRCTVVGPTQAVGESADELLMSVFAILFWLWLVVSTTIFVKRRIGGRRARSTSDAVKPAPHPKTQPAGLETPPPDEVAPPATVDVDVKESALASVPAERPPADRPPIDAIKPSTRPTLGIADALSGITMPCDLAPLTIGVSDLDPDRVDLATSSAGIGDVADGLTSELDRLGYAVSDLGAGEFLANRDGTVVRMKIHDRPALSVRADGRGFPTAPPEGIVVEMALT
jgi:hypothetical protein